MAKLLIFIFSWMNWVVRGQLRSLPLGFCVMCSSGQKTCQILRPKQPKALKPPGVRNGTVVQTHGQLSPPYQAGLFPPPISQDWASLLVDKDSCCQKSIWSSDLPSISSADESDKWILAMNFNSIKQWIFNNRIRRLATMLEDSPGTYIARLLLGHV